MYFFVTKSKYFEAVKLVALEKEADFDIIGQKQYNEVSIERPEHCTLQNQQFRPWEWLLEQIIEFSDLKT